MGEFIYTIIRTKRRSMSLIIDNKARLTVRVPLDTPDKDIQEFVNKKQHWIRSKQHQVTVFEEKHSPVIFGIGESVLFLGNSYTILKKHVKSIEIDGTYIVFPEENTIDDLITWYKFNAKQIFIERVEKYSKMIGVKYNEIKISNAKTRWGSCSSNNSLNLAWRLILCPLSVIDYVIVHELSHITYKNHSAAFWTRVKTILPNYLEHENWLKANRGIMEII